MKNYPTKMRMLIAGIGESLPAITEVDDTFGIMKLPAEIRNKIYFELLVANRSIVIKRSTNGSARHSKTRPRSPSKRKYNITAYIESDRGFREPDKASLKREHPSAVLLANKSIRREARQIFYGANTFIFLDSLALFEFLMRSGSNFAFLKNIKVVNLNFHYAFHLRRSLMALKAPTRVDLTVGNTPSKESTPAAIATWMWQDVVKHFVERRAEWRDHDDDSEDDREERNSAKAAGPSAERKVYQGGVYIKYPIVCVKKQEKRFNTLVFGYTPDQWFKIGERAAIQTCELGRGPRQNQSRCLGTLGARDEAFLEGELSYNPSGDARLVQRRERMERVQRRR